VGSISLETLHDRTDLIFFGTLNALCEFLVS
jgi:DNA-binding Xre family transcriptional regulator